MDNCFNNNLAALKKTNPEILELISIGLNDAVKAVPAKNGNMVPEAVKDGKPMLVHSRYDPVKEAERFVTEAKPAEFDVFIVFGFGYAYHLEELLKSASPDSVIIVLEQSAEMIASAMHHRDLAVLLSDERCRILIDPGEEELSKALAGKSTRKVSFLTHRGSYQLATEYYSNIRSVAKSYLSAKEVNIATLAKFEKTWSSNIARNCKRYLAAPGVNIFYDAFQNIPALVVSAGPSLPKSLEFIRTNSQKILIIAVDTAYKILLSEGIEPHFCVCVDPQIVNARYFEGDKESSTIMVADPTVHPSVSHLYKGRVVYSGMAFQMMKWIEEITGPKGELAYGGSVSTNAYDLAKRLGASPVVLVGQDLAFTGGLAHSKGSYLDEQVFKINSRFYTPLMFNRSQLHALPPIFVKGIRSPRVHTNQKMMIFTAWFEKRNDPDLVNASLDGVMINNVRHIPMDELFFPAVNKDLREMVNDIYREQGVNEKTGIEASRQLAAVIDKFQLELKSLLPELETAERLSSQLLSLVQDGSKDPGKLDYILKKLDKTDRMIESRSTLKDLIGFTVQKVIHTITEGYEIDEDDERLSNDEKIAKRSLFLYRGLLEGCLFIEKILNKMKTVIRS